MRRFDWVFIDLDGTLADTRELLYFAYAAFVQSHGIRPHYSEFQEMDGPSILEIVSTLSDRHGIAGDVTSLVSQYEDFVIQHAATRAVAAPNALDAVVALRAHGCRLWLVTSAQQVYAQSVLNRTELETFFDGMTAGVHPSKPDPASYLVAIASAGADATRSAAIEDSHNGVQAAVAAGLYTIGYKDRRLHEVGAERVVNDLEVAADIIVGKRE